MTPSRTPGGLSPSSSDDELLNDLLDGRLGAAETRALEARLEREPLLREGYDELLRTRELFRAAPDPEPPADFTARVRARLEAELAASPPPARQAGQLELAPGMVPEPALSSVPEVPRVWRRLMVTAYAAAALLMVGIGVVSLQRGKQSETHPGAARNGAAAPIETARSTAAPLEAAGGWDDEAEVAARKQDKKDLSDADAATLPPLQAGGKAESPKGESPQGESKESQRVGELAAPASAGARGAPRPGPGGSVRPGLREPSDMAPAAPATAPPPMLPPAAPAPAPTAPAADPTGQPGSGEGAGEPAPEPAPTLLAPALPTEPVANVLLLEARTAVEGRALVARVLRGPGGRDADTEEALGGFTRVGLRRADERADSLLLARLRAAAPAAADLPASPPSGGEAPTPAAGAAAPGPTVLADFWQDLSPEQQARLEALLGPLPAPAVAPSAGGGGAVPTPPPALPRRVRIVITAAR